MTVAEQDKTDIIKFFGEPITVTYTDKFIDMMCNYVIEIQNTHGVNFTVLDIPKLIKVASKYNEYNCMRNDIKAGNILVNNCELSDIITSTAKALRELNGYKQRYDEKYKQYEYVSIERGKRILSTMLENKGLI